MGTFLMMSGVARADRSQVEDALRDFAEQHAGTLKPLTDGETADPAESLLIAESEQGNVTVLYPSSFTDWDGASQHLSATLQGPVFSLHVHDGDLWMYLLFAGGQEVDRFNPRPDYWEELPPEELRAWAGDAAAVCRHWPHVTVEQIENYLVRWEDEDDEEQGTAYPGDESGAGDAWQVVDFMAKVGLAYPADEGGSQRGARYRFQVKE